MTLNLYEAKTQLSSLVDQAAAGAEIIIAKNGKPMAKLFPFKEAIKRRPGRLKGKVWMSKDFDAPMCQKSSKHSKPAPTMTNCFEAAARHSRDSLVGS